MTQEATPLVSDFVFRPVLNSSWRSDALAGSVVDWTTARRGGLSR
ncbi:hypothetical protein PLANPX_4617 [Lacipirellula parvula]|uniref:Uncharacterized protein n=1 Tax=Lacipirellula parvula TaxID=2650471 RepID=A0A5K7XF38_9BACT|nr:hypothetical protein PLANPX_4617 [Lacipirellula parvula]